MAIIDPAPIVLTILGGVAGLYVHEGSHYLVGMLSGAKPFVGEWAWFTPSYIDYHEPRAFSRRQAKAVGGIVFIWPACLFGLLLVTDRSQFQSIVPLVGFFAGASGISWTDGLAFKKPEQWIEFTAGEPLHRSDIE